jgi:hypothetical protein
LGYTILKKKAKESLVMMTILKEESLYKTDVFTPKSQFLEVGFLILPSLILTGKI